VVDFVGPLKRLLDQLLAQIPERAAEDDAGLVDLADVVGLEVL